MKNRTKSRKKRKAPVTLTTIRPMVAGIDIGSREHWVCGPQRPDGEPNVERFGTTTPELEELADWLIGQGVESVAMESTHVYWIPLYEILEERGLEVILVNSRHLNGVPGRKTDFLDCQWIQLLHSCGLLKGSFRPKEDICALRALQRQLDNLAAERTKCVQWMQKALDQMNVKVHHAVTDITGKTGMSIIRAIVAGQRDPAQLATLRDYRCRKSEAEITAHLTGNWRSEHLYNLGSALRLFDVIEAEITSYEKEVVQKMKRLQPPERQDAVPLPHPNSEKEKTIQRLGEQQQRTDLYRISGVDLFHIDGIRAKTATTIFTEVGTDLSPFPNENAFVSWMRLAPRVAISGGKPLPRRRNSLGASRVAHVLRMAALTLARSQTALGAYFRRIARRKGKGVAVFATARKLATLVYRMLRYGEPYVDEGAQRYEARYLKRRIDALQDSARALGYVLTPQQHHAEA